MNTCFPPSITEWQIILEVDWFIFFMVLFWGIKQMLFIFYIFQLVVEEVLLGPHAIVRKQIHYNFFHAATVNINETI